MTKKHKCASCIHCEMCKWIDEVKQSGCDFYTSSCDDIAKERYADLCAYFGEEKDILKNRKDFTDWLERIKWHIHKAEELFDKYEKHSEPCEAAVSREAFIERYKEWMYSETEEHLMMMLWQSE